MKLKLAGLTVVAAALVCGLSTTAAAHHSVLHYDGKKIVTISGVVVQQRRPRKFNAPAAWSG